jgi:hypothetical protein
MGRAKWWVTRLLVSQRMGELASQRIGGSEVGGGDRRSQLCASREIDRGRQGSRARLGRAAPERGGRDRGR